MSQELLDLIEKARLVRMTPEDREAQRVSFAYGNTRLDNEGMTRDVVERASADLKGHPYCLAMRAATSRPASV
jgi:hypothetical protein